MPTVPEQLASARQAAGLSMQQVIEATKLKAEQIQALEEGRYTVFPAPIYIRGSMRTYAKLLKMDVPKLMAQLDLEFSKNKELSDPPPLTPPAAGIIDWIMLQLSKLDWKILGGIAVVLILLLGAWVFTRPSAPTSKKSDPLSNLGSGLYIPKPSPKPGSTIPLTPTTNAPEGRLPRVVGPSR